MTFLLYVCLCLIWGSTWLAIKIGLDDAPPCWSAAIRFVIAFLLIFLIGKIRRVEYPRRFGDFVNIAIPGVFLYGFSYLLVYLAEVHIDSALTAVLFAVFPFLVAGFSFLMLKEEKPRGIQWLGVVAGFVGVVIVFYDALRESHFIFWGSLMVILSSMSSAFGTVYVRARLRNYDISMMVSIQMAAGALFLIITSVIFEPLSAFEITPKSVITILYLAIFGSVIAFSGYYWLLKRTDALIVSMIAVITPVIAVVLGILVRSELFTLETALGSVLILLGVFMVIRKPGERPGKSV
jgi:drug/metabolite transporter (DMT)-like permease